MKNREPSRNRSRKTWNHSHAIRQLMLCLILLAVWMSLQPDIHAANFSITGIPQPPSDQLSYLNYLVMTGQPPYSRYHHYPASYATYRDYRLLAYGHPSQVPGNRYSSTDRQYACLGFSYDELKVTNTLFPDDAPGGASKSKPFSWVELNQGSKASTSWSRMNPAQTRFLKETPLTYRNNGFGLMTFGNLGLNETNTIVLAPPSWHLGSAIYTEHYLPGVSYKEIRYATFYCSGGGGVELSCSIDILASPDPDGFFTFPDNSDELRIPYRLTGRIVAMSGLARASDIVIRGIGSSDGYANGTENGPFVFEGIRTVNRSDLSNSAAGSAEIHAKTFVVSAMGDIIIQEAVKSVPIREKKPTVPMTVAADVRGSIGFFSGSRTLNGRVPAASGRRFLGLETIWLTVRFNKPVQYWQYTFLGAVHAVPAAAGQLEFTVPIKLPLDQSSLTWNDQRLREPYRIDITGFDREEPARMVTAVIGQIELTGDIFDLLYVQTAG